MRDCRGEARLARRVRSTRIAHIAIIHSQNIIIGYRGRGVISITRIYSAGEACLAPTAWVLLRRAMARRYNRNAI